MRAVYATKKDHGDNINKWTVKQLEQLYKAKKTKKDPPTGTKRTILLQQCLAVAHRPLPELLPMVDKQDQDDDGDENIELLCRGCGLCEECVGAEENDGIFCLPIDDHEEGDESMDIDETAQSSQQSHTQTVV